MCAVACIVAAQFVGVVGTNGGRRQTESVAGDQ